MFNTIFHISINICTYIYIYIYVYVEREEIAKLTCILFLDLAESHYRFIENVGMSCLEHCANGVLVIISNATKKKMP